MSMRVGLGVADQWNDLVSQEYDDETVASLTAFAKAGFFAAS
jgi:hypothetical protein